jgi:hypothetical protein
MVAMERSGRDFIVRRIRFSTPLLEVRAKAE